jgi:hypothetical protein
VCMCVCVCGKILFEKVILMMVRQHSEVNKINCASHCGRGIYSNDPHRNPVRVRDVAFDSFFVFLHRVGRRSVLGRSFLHGLLSNS